MNFSWIFVLATTIFGLGLFIAAVTLISHLTRTIRSPQFRQGLRDSASFRMKSGVMNLDQAFFDPASSKKSLQGMGLAIMFLILGIALAGIGIKLISS